MCVVGTERGEKGESFVEWTEGTLLRPSEKSGRKAPLFPLF